MISFRAMAAAMAIAALASGAATPVEAKSPNAVRPHRHVNASHMTLRYAPAEGSVGPRPGHLTALVGDRESGLGFYALPRQYRTARLHDRRGDAIRYAIDSEVGNGYYYGIGGETYGERHHHTVFNPVDGYGTPFFAGYYGPAGDPDEDRGPFGQPYD